MNYAGAAMLTSLVVLWVALWLSIPSMLWLAAILTMLFVLMLVLE